MAKSLAAGSAATVRDDGAWLAELLVDLEADEMARLHLTEALRQVVVDPEPVHVQIHVKRWCVVVDLVPAQVP